jgi:hypothetical protein
MRINLHFGTPRDAFDRSNALAMHDIHQDRVYPFGSNGPLNLAILDVAYDPAIKVVAPLRESVPPQPGGARRSPARASADSAIIT